MAAGIRHEHLWSIVLAEGDGIRTREFIRTWLGYEKPKQYCAFVGTHTMFQHTLDRAAQVTPWERIAIVAARHHQHEVWQQLDGRPASTVLLQPNNADTAAGIFLPLTFILARDPRATVVVYPSDHFIYPEGAFLKAVDHAVWGSSLIGGCPVLLAAKPDSLELEYGWIKPGRFLGWTGMASFRAVEKFVEKPDQVTARELVAKGRDLWRLGWKYLPEMMERSSTSKRPSTPSMN